MGLWFSDLGITKDAVSWTISMASKNDVEERNDDQTLPFMMLQRHTKVPYRSTPLDRILSSNLASWGLQRKPGETTGYLVSRPSFSMPASISRS